jgi:hypothetical protein
MSRENRRHGALWTFPAIDGMPLAMESPATDQLKQAIETEHGGSATFVRSVPVHHSVQGKTLWNGAVQVFDLADSSTGATRAYAWSQGLADGQRRLCVVPEGGAVTGPREAVSSFLSADNALTA